MKEKQATTFQISSQLFCSLPLNCDQSSLIAGEGTIPRKLWLPEAPSSLHKQYVYLCLSIAHPSRATSHRLERAETAMRGCLGIGFTWKLVLCNLLWTIPISQPSTRHVCRFLTLHDLSC